MKSTDIVQIVGWTALIISWVLPKKWFKDPKNYTGIKMSLASFALGIFLGAWIVM